MKELVGIITSSGESAVNNNAEEGRYGVTQRVKHVITLVNKKRGLDLYVE